MTAGNHRADCVCLTSFSFARTHVNARGCSTFRSRTIGVGIDVYVARNLTGCVMEVRFNIIYVKGRTLRKYNSNAIYLAKQILKSLKKLSMPFFYNIEFDNWGIFIFLKNTSLYRRENYR